MRTTRMALVALATAALLGGCQAEDRAAPSPTITQTPPLHPHFDDPLATLPLFHLATGAGPATFVARRYRRLALYDSASGRFLRYLTNVRPINARADLPLKVVDSRIWYLHASGRGCGGPIVSRPSTGGAPRVEVTPIHDATLNDAAFDPESGTLAFSVAPCTGRSPKGYIDIRRPAHPDVRIEMPHEGARAYGLSLARDHLVFTVDPVSPDSTHDRYFGKGNDIGSTELFEVDINDLAVGSNPLSVVRMAPEPGAACGWRSASYTKIGLLATRYCGLGQKRSRRTPTVFRLNPKTMVPVARSPIEGVMVNVAFDGAGHVLTDVRGEDVIAWTAAGARHIRRGGCTTPDTQFTHCPNDATW